MTISSSGPRRLAAIAAVTCLAGVVPATATPATAGATGRICGAARCLTLTHSLANELAQRNDLFEAVSTPRRAAFYRITIKAAGQGFISKAILWVPSAHAWYVQEYSKWPEVGYWRTEGKAARAPLARIARSLRPFPSPAKWVLPR